MVVIPWCTFFSAAKNALKLIHYAQPTLLKRSKTTNQQNTRGCGHRRNDYRWKNEQADSCYIVWITVISIQATTRVGGHGFRISQCQRAVVQTSKSLPVQIDGGKNIIQCVNFNKIPALSCCERCFVHLRWLGSRKHWNFSSFAIKRIIVEINKFRFESLLSWVTAREVGD